MDPSKRGKWPLPIRTLAQTFLRAIVRKGKNQSFSNLNPKERNLKSFFYFLNFFFERSPMDPSKRGKWPLPIQTLAQTFLRAIVRKGKNQSFSNLNPKERNLKSSFFFNFFFFFERSPMNPSKSGKWPLQIRTLPQAIL